MNVFLFSLTINILMFTNLTFFYFYMIYFVLSVVFCPKCSAYMSSVNVYNFLSHVLIHFMTAKIVFYPVIVGFR